LHTPDILIVNPAFGGWFDLPAFKVENGKVETKYNGFVGHAFHDTGNDFFFSLAECFLFTLFFFFVVTVIDSNSLKEYDDHLSICDDPETIATKINQLLCT